MKRLLAICCLLVARSSYADDPVDSPRTAPVDDQSLVNPEPPPSTAAPTTPPPVASHPSGRPSDEPTARDVDGAPRPGTESGRTDHPEGDSLIRDVGQGVLTVPRLVLVGAMAPVRAGLYAYDHYGISERLSSTFFDDTATYGIYPTASFDSLYGINVGARFVHRDILGHAEKLSLRGTTGGQFRVLVDGSLRTGHLLGDHVTLEVRAELERRPREPFYGIGNRSMERDARYRTEVERVTSYLDVRPFDRFVVRATGAVTQRTYAPSEEGTPIDAMYDTTMLTGFSGAQNMYGELEVRLDHRAREITPGGHRIFDTGYMLSAFAGRVHQLDASNDYWRYGGEAQHFLGLGVGPRSLMTRLRVEAVTGTLDDVVFDQLPSLGGAAVLRGYAWGRFRDRASVVGTAEYFWGLGPLFMASLFVDAGRVYGSLDEMTTNGLRVGYGASLQFHSSRQFIAGLSLATSADGGFFANLTFDPVFDFDPRAERR